VGDRSFGNLEKETKRRTEKRELGASSLPLEKARTENNALLSLFGRNVTRSSNKTETQHIGNEETHLEANRLLHFKLI
jgi:hypothetical protein